MFLDLYNILFENFIISLFRYFVIFPVNKSIMFVSAFAF